METFIYIIGAIIALVIVLALIAPKSYEVSRSIEINKPAKELFEYLRFLKNHDAWSPWFERDPNMKKTMTGTDGEIGCVSAWESDHKQVGHGEQEITGLEDSKEISMELRFLKPFKSTSDAYLRLDEGNNNTTVTWGFSGNNKFPVSIMMLFMNMDKAVGGDFEAGLAKLKSVIEN